MQNYENYEIPENFLDEEVRDEFVVTTTRKKIWAAELELLNELLRVCNKHDIRVHVFGGTLLGAVRHGGFIPWDDDVDVCLLHDDYEKLLKVAPSEIKYPFFFQTALTDRRYFLRFARMRKSDTTGVITGQETPEYNNGIFIDVFILNGYTDNKFLLRKQLFEMRLTWKLCRAYIARLDEKAKYKRPFIGTAQFIEKAVAPYETYVHMNDMVQGRYDNKTQKVALLTHGKKMMKKYWCYASDFDETVYLKFENLMVPAPANYERFLLNAYGDYMKFPPVEERGKWHENVITFDPDMPYVEYLKLKGKGKNAGETEG